MERTEDKTHVDFQKKLMENQALLQEMKKDENVIVIGEDVAGGAGTNGEQDAWGGVLGVTKGLLKHFECVCKHRDGRQSLGEAVSRKTRR